MSKLALVIVMGTLLAVGCHGGPASHGGEDSTAPPERGTMMGMGSNMSGRMGPGMMEAADTGQESAAASSDEGGDLGIGPVKKLELEPLDPKLAKQGRKLFDAHCVACHDLDERKVGPPLRDVATQRTPEFIMNMILNASEMEKHDPVAKRLRAQYPVSMPDSDLDRTQARAVLEYLRSVPKR